MTMPIRPHAVPPRRCVLWIAKPAAAGMGPRFFRRVSAVEVRVSRDRRRRRGAGFAVRGGNKYSRSKSTCSRTGEQMGFTGRIWVRPGEPPV